MAQGLKVKGFKALGSGEQCPAKAPAHGCKGKPRRVPPALEGRSLILSQVEDKAGVGTPLLKSKTNRQTLKSP